MVDEQAKMAENKPKGLALAGMVIGICGAAISITPCLWLIGILPDIVGIVLSAIALRKIKNGTGAGRGMATAGLVCSIVGIVLWFISMAVFGAVMNELSKSMR